MCVIMTFTLIELHTHLPAKENPKILMQLKSEKYDYYLKT